jgi:hypothetical protein
MIRTFLSKTTNYIRKQVQELLLARMRRKWKEVYNKLSVEYCSRFSRTDINKILEDC